MLKDGTNMTEHESAPEMTATPQAAVPAEPSAEGLYPTFHYQTLFLSDLHLGSDKTAAPYLYEFLTHLDFKTLKTIYLVGDVVGGWERQGEKQHALPEMEKRILDVLNYAADQGITVHFLPGNHDEKLRPMLDKLQNRRSNKTFAKSVEFSNETFYETEGPDKKRIKIVHGDQHDPDLFVKPWFRPITFLTSAAYDLMVKVNYDVSDFMYQRFGYHVSFAKPLKNSFKSVIGYFFSHDSLLNGLRETGYDGILMGHTHMAGTKEFDTNGRKSYLINDGDWVESSTAAYVDNPAELPKIINYKSEREKLGFGDLPDVDDEHPACFAAMRGRTMRQVRLMHRMWPGRNRTKVFKEYTHALYKYVEHQQQRVNLQEIQKTLVDTGIFPPAARVKLNAIFAETNAGSYLAQKRGLRDIFDKNHAGLPLEGNDLIFVRTVTREFSLRAERKMRKHLEVVRSMADKMDYRMPQTMAVRKKRPVAPA